MCIQRCQFVLAVGDAATTDGEDREREIEPPGLEPQRFICLLSSLSYFSISLQAGRERDGAARVHRVFLTVEWEVKC